MLKKWIKIIGKLLTIISFIYLAITFWEIKNSFKLSATREMLVVLLVGCIMQTIVVLASSYPWGVMVGLLSGRKINWIELINVFAKANILKYLPGNFFHYIGRNEIAVEYDLKHADVALATFLDMVIGLMVGILISCLGYKTQLKGNIFFYIFLFFFGIIFFVTLGIATIHHSKKSYDYGLSMLITTKGLRKIVKIIIYYILQNIVSIVIVSFIYMYISVDKDILHILSVGYTYILASVIGTITPGAPAGIGIRESVMIKICQVDKNIIFGLAVIMRAVCVLADFLAYIFSCSIYMVKKNER